MAYIIPGMYPNMVNSKHIQNSTCIFNSPKKKQNQSALFAKREEYEHKMLIEQKG
jgi:hypothetical protein